MKFTIEVSDRHAENVRSKAAYLESNGDVWLVEYGEEGGIPVQSINEVPSE
jgi:hypothetical protein